MYLLNPINFLKTGFDSQAEQVLMKPILTFYFCFTQN